MTETPLASAGGRDLSPDPSLTQAASPPGPAADGLAAGSPLAQETQGQQQPITQPSTSLLSEPQKQPAPTPQGQAPAGQQQPATPAEAPGADIVYDFKYPENTGPVDKEREGQFTGMLRKHRISQEGGQEFLDAYITERNREVQLQWTNWNRQQEQWKNEVMSDEKIGGAKFDATLNNCRAAVQKYGTDQLREVLNSTGAGNHPAMVRFINNMQAEIARLRNNPRPVQGGKPIPQVTSRAERRYGSTGTK